MELQPGDFVTHHKHPEWGVGEVDRQVENDQVLVWFKNVQQVECHEEWLRFQGRQERLLEDR